MCPETETTTSNGAAIDPGGDDEMNQTEERDFEEVRLSRRELPESVNRARQEARADDEANETIARPRMEAQLAACRMMLAQLKEWHREIVDTTDLDPTSYSRAAALWLLSGRCLGLLEALIVQAGAGIDTETMVIGRALHDADQTLRVFSDPDEEELLRVWLDDEGKHNYVRTGAARAAQARFEEKLDEAMTRQGVTPIERTGDKSAYLFDRMSRVAHNRRSTCVTSYWERGREMACGRHPSTIRRAAVVEWTSAMTVEVLNSVGDALRAFHGGNFFTREIQPLIQSVEAVRKTAPLDEDSIRAAAGK